MGFATSMTGAGVGVSIIMMCNALRRVAYFKRPWEHVIAAGVGAAFFNYWHRVDLWLNDRVKLEMGYYMEKNKDVLDPTYKEILGDAYDGFFDMMKGKSADK